MASNKSIVLIHHEDMQLHAPPEDTKHSIFELPRRVEAIESALHGRGIPDLSMPDVEVARESRSNKGKLRKPEPLSPPDSWFENLWELCTSELAPMASPGQILACHSVGHTLEVKKQCEIAMKSGPFFRVNHELGGEDSDIYYSGGSWPAMLRAVGGAIHAVRSLFMVPPPPTKCQGGELSSDNPNSEDFFSSEMQLLGPAKRSSLLPGLSAHHLLPSCFRAAFAIVRPPGHHCEDKSNGFCFFNNTALAAAHAIDVLKVERVAIVDWDFHHGDGYIFFGSTNFKLIIFISQDTRSFLPRRSCFDCAYVS